MTILVGYSPSPEGKAAVEFGIEQARAFGRGGITDENCHDLSWCDIGRSSLNY